MSQTSAILGLPYIQAAQAQKHVTHNEALQALDVLVQLSVIDDRLSTPPTTPEATDRYIVAAGATDAWAGRDGQIVVYEGTQWVPVAPQAGWRAWIETAGTWAVFDGGAWARPLEQLAHVSRFGLNASATEATPFVVRGPGGLWDSMPTAQGGSGSTIQSINRENSTLDCGLSFQTGYTSHGLFGFFGSDQLRLTTSADGIQFQDAFRVDPQTGIAAQPARPKFNLTTNYDNYLSTGNWTKVALNLGEFDPLDTLDSTANHFVAPVRGTYMLSARTIFAQDTTLDVRLQHRLVKNATEILSKTSA